MADRFMSAPVILSDLELRDAIVLFFQADLVNARTVRLITTKFGRITHAGDWRISMGQLYISLPQEGGAQAQPIFRFPSIYPYTFDAGIHIGEGLVFG